MAKVYDYVLVLQRQHLRIIDAVSKLMLVLAVIAFFFEALRAVELQLAWFKVLFWVIFSVFIIAWGVFCFLQQKKGVVPYYRLGFLLASWGFFTIPEGGIWLSLIYLLAVIIEKPVKMNTEIAVDNDEIVINTFPKKTYQWSEVNNFLIKDGLLTIDFKNNHLIQRMIEAEVSKETETEFNAYCAAQLATV